MAETCPTHPAFRLVDGVCAVCAARGKDVDSPEVKAVVAELGDRLADAAKPLLHRNSFSFRISREMAVDLGMVEPTYDEKLATYRRLVEYRGECAEARAVYARALERIAALDPEEWPIATKILAMHAPVEDRYGGGLPPRCEGCPADTEDGYPEWPCSTVQAVCEFPGLSIELPEAGNLIDDFEPVHPDDQPPWEPPKPLYSFFPAVTAPAGGVRFGLTDEPDKPDGEVDPWRP